MSIVKTVKQEMKGLMFLPILEEIVHNLYLPLSVTWNNVLFHFEIPHEFIEMFTGTCIILKFEPHGSNHEACYKTPNGTLIETSDYSVSFVSPLNTGYRACLYITSMIVTVCVRKETGEILEMETSEKGRPIEERNAQLCSVYKQLASVQ